MDAFDSEFWISWICADHIPLENDGKYFFISSPSRESKFLAEDFFLQYYKKSLDDGCLSEDDLIKLLKKRKLWDDEKEKNLKKLQKDAELIKIQLYEHYMSSGMVKKLKEALRGTNQLIEEQLALKTSFDNLTAKSIAYYSKQTFILGCSIFKAKNKPYWKNPAACWNLSDQILPVAYKAISKYHLTDTDYRELSRSLSWRNIWHVRKNAPNVFGRPLVDLTVPQRHLLAWSNLYDSVYNHSSPPPECVIEDNDILDGWMLFQKRKRESEMAKKSIMDKVNPKIMQSEEVFIMAGGEKYGAAFSEDNLDIIYEMNDPLAKIAFKRRMAQVARDGEVHEGNMLDRQEQLRMQATAQGARR